MKRLTAMLVFASLVFLFSCGGSQEQTIRELRQQIQVERQMAQRVKTAFNLLLGISIAGAVAALLIGVAMGSKARNDAENQPEKLEG